MFIKTKNYVNLLILFTLITAPLVAGSYFGDFRWPAIILAILCPLALLTPQRSYSPDKLPSFTLLASCAIISIQGIWMTYNSWGDFTRDLYIHSVHIPWVITELPNQPFPKLPGSVDWHESWDRITYIIPCLILCITTKKLTQSGRLKLKHICATIFWTGTTVAAIGLIQRFTNTESILGIDHPQLKSPTLFFGTYRSPGIATCYLIISLNLGLSHLLSSIHRSLKSRKPKPSHAIFISLGCIITFSAAIMAGSKAGSVLAIVSLMLWIMLNLKAIFYSIKHSPSLLPSGSHHERNILLIITIVAALLATLSSGNTVSKRWKDSKTARFDTLSKRQVANSIQIDMIQSKKWNKLAGLGPGAFYPLFPYYKGSKGDSLTQTWVYAHNDHLQTLVEWGYLGTGCFIILIGGGGTIVLFEQFARRKRHKASQIFYFRGMTIAMLICLIHATVDFPFQIESIAMTFSVILGAAWAGRTLRIK